MSQDNNFDLESAMQDWQSRCGPTLDDAVAGARRSLSRWKAMFIAEMAVSVAGLMAGGVMAASGNVIIGGAAIGLSLIGGAAAWLARRQSRRDPIGAVSDEITLLQKETRLSRRLGWAGLVVCAAALIFLAIVLMSKSGESQTRRPLWMVIAALIFIGTGIVLSVRMLKKARRRETLLRTWQDEIAGED